MTTSGVVTAYTLTGLSPSDFTESSTGSQTLNTAAHSWALNDYNTPTAGTNTSDDATAGTPLNLTGNTGVTATTGNLFTPDITLNGTTGDLTTTSAAITPNANFTISAWVDPTSDSGTIISQSGTDDAAFTLSITTTGEWQISMNNAGTVGNTYDTGTGGKV